MPDKYGLRTIKEIRADLAHRKAIGRVGRNKEDGFCEFHERDELGFHAFFYQAERLKKQGVKQVQCNDCHKYLWPHELGNPLASPAPTRAKTDER